MSALSRLQLKAEQVLASESEHVPSPCVSVCVVHPTLGLCEGCLRNIDEIGAWGQMPSAQQRQVWQHIQQRCTQRLSGS